MLTKAVSILRYAVGGGGLYYGLSMLGTDPAKAVAITSLLAVGFVGVFSFISHVLLHEGDAKQIGFSAKNASFQFEVGFANLAFGVVAVISYFANWGARVDTALVLGYAIYLLQAALLHAWQAHKVPKTRKANLIRAGLTFVFSGAMLYIALSLISSSAF